MRDYFEIGCFWVLCNKDGDGFLHYEDYVFTKQLSRALKFDTYEDAYSHVDEMIEICRDEIEYHGDSNKVIYLRVVPKKVSITID